MTEQEKIRIFVDQHQKVLRAELLLEREQLLHQKTRAMLLAEIDQADSAHAATLDRLIQLENTPRDCVIGGVKLSYLQDLSR